MRVLRAILLRLGLIVAGLAVVLLLLEGAYRVYKLARYGMVGYVDIATAGYLVPHPVYGYALARNFSSERIPLEIRQSVYGRHYSMDRRFTTNSLGFRGPEVSPDKPPRTYRIVAFGGSSTMSIEVDDEDTWPAQLEATLNRDQQFARRHGARRVEVINAAVSGWRSLENYLRLREEVRHFQPDLLLLALNWNDAWKTLENGMDPYRVTSLQRPWWVAFKIFENLKVRYEAYRFTGEDRIRRRRTLLTTDRAWAAALEKHVRAMRAIAGEIGAEVALVNLPGIARVKDIGTPDVELLIERARGGESNFLFWAELKDVEMKLFEEFDRRYSTAVIDVHRQFEVFAGRRRLALFADEVHFSRAGGAEVARAIAAALHDSVAAQKNALQGGPDVRAEARAR